MILFFGACEGTAWRALWAAERDFFENAYTVYAVLSLFGRCLKWSIEGGVGTIRCSCKELRPSLALGGAYAKWQSAAAPGNGAGGGDWIMLCRPAAMATAAGNPFCGASAVVGLRRFCEGLFGVAWGRASAGAGGDGREWFGAAGTGADQAGFFGAAIRHLEGIQSDTQ